VKIQSNFSWCWRIAGFAFVVMVSRPATALILSPSTLKFGTQQIWTTSAPQQVTLANNTTSPLSLLNIVASGDYAQTNNCGALLQARSSCVVTVTFSPSATGERAGYLTVIDSGTTPLQTASLKGQGSAPTSKLAISPGVASITINQTAQYQATFNGTVTSKVNWRVDGVTGGNSTVGTISASGLYMAPAVSGAHIISAATRQASPATASAKLVVSNNPGIFTWNNDQAHTGQNVNEIVLNTGNVNSNQFGKLFTLNDRWPGLRSATLHAGCQHSWTGDPQCAVCSH
jgi:hypothetical protein